MNQSLKITMRDGNFNESDRSLSFFNPEVPNSVAAAIAQAFTALSTNEYIDANRITSVNVNEPDTQKGLLPPNLTVEGGAITWLGNGQCLELKIINNQIDRTSVNKGRATSPYNSYYVLSSDETYAADWIKY